MPYHNTRSFYLPLNVLRDARRYQNKAMLGEINAQQDPLKKTVDTMWGNNGKSTFKPEQKTRLRGIEPSVQKYASGTGLELVSSSRSFVLHFVLKVGHSHIR